MASTLATRPVPGVPTGASGRSALAEQHPAQRRLFAPGWPLAAIFVPFPLWWVIGLTEWICPIMAAVMVVHLLRRRAVLAPKGFGVWALFLLWVGVGAVLLQVGAYGAVDDNSSTRIITWAYRLVWYVTITVVLLYVINFRRELTTTRVTRIVGALFVTVTLGGLLGVVRPYFEFQSVLEHVLPHALTSQQFIQKMIHPTAAELQVVLGYVSPRPSAPFAFTNTWGLNYALTLPFFLHSWCGRDGGWRRWAAVPVLLLAAVPGIFSINRGMWGAVVAMALFVAIRSALTGKPAALGAIGGGALALCVLLVASPLGNIVQSRFSNEGSEQGRTYLASLTVESVARTSPLVGLGSTRNVQGNFQSITGGSTAACPRCSPPALGTQGQLWLVVFSQGLLGLGMFLGFFVLVFLRYVRLRSPVSTVALSAMVAWAVTLPVYNSLGIGLMIVMISVGLLCREALDVRELGHWGGSGARLLPLSRLGLAVRAGLPVVAVTAVVGMVLGFGWVHVRPSPFTATDSLLLDEAPRYPTEDVDAVNVDTDGQLAHSAAVVQAAATASGQPLDQVEDRLTVTATPNSRILHLHLTAPSAARAQAGVQAASAEFVKQRTARLEGERAGVVKTLQAKADVLATALQQLDSTLTATDHGTSRDDPSDQSDVLRDTRNTTQTEAHSVAKQLARIGGSQLSGGHTTEPTVVKQSRDRLAVALVGGTTSGLGLGLVLVVLLAAGGPRLRQMRSVRDHVGLPLLGRVPYTPAGVRTFTAYTRAHPMAYVSVDEDDVPSSGLAHTLTDLSAADPRPRGGAVLVASGRTRVDAVFQVRTRLARQGVDVRGLVIATRVRIRRRAATR